MKKKLFSIIFLFIIAACGKEGREAKLKVDALKIDPFLAPIVEKVSGGEGFRGEKAEVRDLIINYNRTVVESQVYIENVRRLKTFTTKKEFTRMFASLEKDRTEGKIMSCALKELAFNEIHLEKGRGTVKTREDWLTEDRDLKTGKKLTDLKDVEYEVLYGVAKENGRWVVSGIDIKKASEYIPPRGTPARVRAQPYNDMRGGSG